MANRVNGQIDVQIRPVKVLGRGPLNMQHLANRGIAKPREAIERQEQFFSSQKKPEAMLRYVGDLRIRSVAAKRRGFHFRAPPPRLARPGVDRKSTRLNSSH